MFLRAVGVCFLVGLAGSLGHTVFSRRAAEAEIQRQGYVLQALDPEPRLKCPWPGAGFTFIATRDGHLVAGGVCVLMARRDPVLVTLPYLR